MTWKELRTGQDRVLTNADRTPAERAIAELMWNSLDAEADNVAVSVDTNELGAATRIVISDNGTGIPFDDVEALFLTEGDSWKKDTKFSPGQQRPMHGQYGRGRLLAYAVASEVKWRTTAPSNGHGLISYEISGYRNRPTGFEVGSASEATGERGTEVELLLRDTQKAAKIGDSNFKLKIIELLAESLSSFPQTTVIWNGNRLAVDDLIESRCAIELPEIDTSVLRGHPVPAFELVEWSEPVGTRKIQLCDDSGAAICEYKPPTMTPAHFSWTAYLTWTGFRDPALMNVADLHVPELRHGELLSLAAEALDSHLASRFRDERGRIVQDWIDEGVYPYGSTPDGIPETVERELFDVVAVIASGAVPRRGTRQKKLTLRLLREALRSEPGRVRRAVEAVVNLDTTDQENLEQLLDRTSLGSIVRASSKVADRLDFIEGLASLLYSDATRRVFREVDQLHPMLVKEPWVFGDEWDVCLSEHGLTRVVKEVLRRHNPDGVVAVEPVTLPDGKRGRVDLLFHKVVPESESERHLVVELKRPGRLTIDHYGQVAKYATGITTHPEVLNTATKWDFWLVGTDLDNTLENERTGREHRVGLAKEYDTHRLWVIRWGELFDSLRHKYQSYRAELDILPTANSGLEYLRRIHLDYLPRNMQEE